MTSVGFLLHAAQRRLRDSVMAAIEGSGLHAGQLAVLGALADKGPLSQRQLGEFAQIEKSSLVLFLDSLQDGGWVSRTPDPNDRRAHRVCLTRKGAAKFAALGPRLQKVQDAFLSPLTTAKQALLIELLTQLAKA